MDRPKRIGIDLQALQTPGSRHRGIGQYARSLLETLFSLPESQAFEFVLLNLAPDIDPGLSLNASVRMRVVQTGRNRLLLRRPFGHFYAPHVVRHFSSCERPAAFYIPSPFDAWNIFDRRWFGDTALIATVYDLIPLLYPSEYLKSDAAQAAYKRRLAFLRTCDHLAAISQTVKNDIVRLLAVDPHRVSVVSAAVPTVFHHALDGPAVPQDTLSKYGISGSYVLSIGAEDSRKNLSRVVQAYAGLPAALRGRFQLVIASQLGEATRQRIQSVAQGCGVTSSLILTGYVGTDDLLALYRGATAFISLSLYEGFGLPLLEAMAMGIPVLTSRTSALGEVAADAALTVDPTDLPAIQIALETILESDALRGALHSRGLVRASEFSWQTSARKLLEIFRRVCDHQSVTSC